LEARQREGVLPPNDAQILGAASIEFERLLFTAESGVMLTVFDHICFCKFDHIALIELFLLIQSQWI
jgi:hypothetical protein